MAPDGLWHFVEAARDAAGDPVDAAAVAAELVDLLKAAGPESMRRFDVELSTVMAEAYGRELWGAAYIMNGGCSDDGFQDFIAWLVGQGRATFYRAVAEPDSLAETVSPRGEGTFACEELIYAPFIAYEQLTGHKMPDWPGVKLRQLERLWDFEDEEEMRRRYPRLTAKFYCDSGAAQQDRPEQLGAARSRRYTTADLELCNDFNKAVDDAYGLLSSDSLTYQTKAVAVRKAADRLINNAIGRGSDGRLSLLISQVSVALYNAADAVERGDKPTTSALQRAHRAVAAACDEAATTTTSSGTTAQEPR